MVRKLTLANRPAAPSRKAQTVPCHSAVGAKPRPLSNTRSNRPHPWTDTLPRAAKRRTRPQIGACSQPRLQTLRLGALVPPERSVPATLSVCNRWKADIARSLDFWLYPSMRYRTVATTMAVGLGLSAASAATASPNARVCIRREAQNGSLNIAPTALSIRSRSTGAVIASRELDDAGSFCALVPRGRYVLSVRLAEPWTRSLPLHWWTRKYPVDVRGGDATFLMTNPEKNDEFQAMTAGRDGWHRLWPVRRTR